jgi:hypothetical protein
MPLLLPIAQPFGRHLATTGYSNCSDCYIALAGPALLPGPIPAAARIETLGKVAMALAVIDVLFAVLTCDRAIHAAAE